MISERDFDSQIAAAAQLISQKKAEPRVFKLSIKQRFEGHTLLDVYAQSFPHVNRAYWRSKIETGNLTVYGKRVAPDFVVQAGQVTSHSVEPKPEPGTNFDIRLLYAATRFWVLHKPAPLPVHAGGRFQNNTLTHMLKTAFPQRTIHLINRLDANTTGIVLVALDKETAHILGKQFENREVKKTYLALVEGQPDKEKFSSTKQVGKSKTRAGGRQLESGKSSQTEFEVLKTYGNNTLLKVTPHSGRTNQIRLHLADLGLPIVGDIGYKDAAYFESNPLTYPSDTLFLHAWKLEFHNPITNRRLEIIARPRGKWNTIVLGSMELLL